jgi:hypothetical protein
MLQHPSFPHASICFVPCHISCSTTTLVIHHTLHQPKGRAGPRHPGKRRVCVPAVMSAHAISVTASLQVSAMIYYARPSNRTAMSFDSMVAFFSLAGCLLFEHPLFTYCLLPCCRYPKHLTLSMDAETATPPSLVETLKVAFSKGKV